MANNHSRATIESRTKTLGIRLTDSEYQRIKNYAAKHKITAATAMRNAAFATIASKRANNNTSALVTDPDSSLNAIIDTRMQLHSLRTAIDELLALSLANPQAAIADKTDDLEQLRTVLETALEKLAS